MDEWMEYRIILQKLEVMYRSQIAQANTRWKAPDEISHSFATFESNLVATKSASAKCNAGKETIRPTDGTMHGRRND